MLASTATELHRTAKKANPDPGHFRYAAEKFSAARRALMLPHPKGEAQSVADAYFEIMLGLKNLRVDLLSDSAQGWVRTINRLMDTDDIEDPSGRGTAIIRAEQLDESERHDFASAVDELAYWLDEAAHGEF